MQEAQQAHLRILGQQSMKVWSNIPGVTLPSEACSIVFPVFIEEDFPVPPTRLLLQSLLCQSLWLKSLQCVHAKQCNPQHCLLPASLCSTEALSNEQHHVHAAPSGVAEQASAGGGLGPHIRCWPAAHHPSHAQSALLLPMQALSLGCMGMLAL